MITDTEMEAMEWLTQLCSNKEAKDVLSIVTDMLGDLDTNKFYVMTDEQKESFMRPFANKIDELYLETRKEGLDKVIKDCEQKRDNGDARKESARQRDDFLI